MSVKPKIIGQYKLQSLQLALIQLMIIFLYPPTTDKIDKSQPPQNNLYELRKSGFYPTELAMQTGTKLREVM